jgi:hypothetical protein
MGGRSLLRIFGNRVRHARISLQRARERAELAASGAAAGEYRLWSAQVEAAGRPARPSATIAQRLDAGHGWPDLMCYPYKMPAGLPLDAIRRPPDTPTWTLEALNADPAGTLRHAPRVNMIRLTKEPNITRSLGSPGRLAVRIIAMEERNNG